jgi:hypothetical protein
MAKKSKLKISEHDLQKTILQNLKWYKNIYVIRNNSFAGKIMRGNGSTGYIKNSQKGAPDIILCKNGLWLGLEIKSEIGEQSKDQKRAEKDIERAGGHYFLIRSIDEFNKVLEYF